MLFDIGLILGFGLLVGGFYTFTMSSVFISHLSKKMFLSASECLCIVFFLSAVDNL